MSNGDFLDDLVDETRQARKIRRNENAKKYHFKNKDRRRNLNKQLNKKYKVRQLYGITIDQKQMLIDHQNGLCAICKNSNNLHVDHCNDTLILRGMLCRPCNWAIGHLKHSIPNLLNAISYLNSPPAQQLLYGHKIPKPIMQYKKVKNG